MRLVKSIILLSLLFASLLRAGGDWPFPDIRIAPVKYEQLVGVWEVANMDNYFLKIDLHGNSAATKFLRLSLIDFCGNENGVGIGTLRENVAEGHIRMNGDENSVFEMKMIAKKKSRNSQLMFFVRINPLDAVAGEASAALKRSREVFFNQGEVCN